MIHPHHEQPAALLTKALDLLNAADAKMEFRLFEAAGRQFPIPALRHFLFQAAAVVHAHLTRLEGTEHTHILENGEPLPATWAEVVWPESLRDLEALRDLGYRWAASTASPERAYFERMLAACAAARAGRIRREIRELRRMETGVRPYWESEADALGLPR